MATGLINGDIGLGSEVGGVLMGLTEGDLTTGTMTGSVTTPVGGKTGAAGAGLTGNILVAFLAT